MYSTSWMTCYLNGHNVQAKLVTKEKKGRKDWILINLVSLSKSLLAFYDLTVTVLNDSLDANFSVDELAGQLLLPVGQLLKYNSRKL